MATRSTVHFKDAGNPTPIIVYRHWDGYPHVEHEGERYGMLADLDRFFGEIDKAYPDGWHGMDAADLAARWLIWLADHYAHNYPDPAKLAEPHKLRFSSVYLMHDDPGDIQYRYHAEVGPVTYAPVEQPKRPRISYDERNLTTDTWRHVEVSPRPRPAKAKLTEPEPEQEETTTTTTGRATTTENGLTTTIINDGPNHHEIITKEGDDHQYALILGVNDDTSFITYNYLSNGDGYGTPLYCGSKHYKSLKGARKKARQYLGL